MQLEKILLLSGMYFRVADNYWLGATNVANTMEIKQVKHGLIYNGIMYGWINKKLYRLPYFNTKTKRSYDLKEVKQIGNHYLISRNKVNLLTLKNKTTRINTEIIMYNETLTPF